jgi:hypothetical protein
MTVESAVFVDGGLVGWNVKWSLVPVFDGFYEAGCESYQGAMDASTPQSLVQSPVAKPTQVAPSHVLYLVPAIC